MTRVHRGDMPEPHQHVDASTRHLDASLLQLDLPKELDALRRAGIAEGKHVAKALAKYDDLRLVLIAFERGARLDRHSAPGRVCIQAIEGRLTIRIGTEAVELEAGGILTIEPSVEHEVEALAQSALLLTIAWPKK